MKVKKVADCYCMNDCKHKGEGFVIAYNDDESLIYLCEECFIELKLEVDKAYELMS